MRRTNPILIILATLAVCATIVLSSREGGLFNVHLQHRIMDGPRSVETTITTPRNRRWIIDRHIVWPDQCPPNQPCPRP